MSCSPNLAGSFAPLVEFLSGWKAPGQHDAEHSGMSSMSFHESCDRVSLLEVQYFVWLRRRDDWHRAADDDADWSDSAGFQFR